VSALEFLPVRGRIRSKPAEKATPQVLVNAVQFCAWVSQASPGEHLEYHRGLLALDASEWSRDFAGHRRRELNRLAHRAMWAANQGLVHLVQRRNRPRRFFLLRDRAAACRGHSPAPVICPFEGGRSVIIDTNHPHLDDAGHMPIGEIAQLPADHLALLQEEAAAALDASKELKEWIDAAIVLRFGNQAAVLRREAGKDTGTVRFEQDGVVVVADLPKKVDWDQRLVAGVVERIRASGEDPAQYVDITIKVPERKYNAWPENMRAAFAPARTVRTGKQSITLSLEEPGK
jgi:hypothetical protein